MCSEIRQLKPLRRLGVKDNLLGLAMWSVTGQGVGFVGGEWHIQGMSNQKEVIYRTAQDLVGEYELVIKRIENACDDYDSKRMIDPGAMALQLRILLIDTSTKQRGRSLMNIMGVSQNQRILSTVPQPITQNTVASMGFLGLRGTSAEVDWYATLDESQGARNVFPTERWLDEVVFKGKGIPFSRRKIIRVIADRENGAHVDPTIDPDYYEIAKNNGMGFIFVKDNEEEISLGNPFPAAMRQLCFEVLKTDIRLRNEGWLWKVANT